MDQIELLNKKFQRERQARKQAEKILEDKAIELYQANQSLLQLNQNLEAEIEKRSKSLSESEKKYRQLVEQAQDLIYNVDVNGFFTFANGVTLSKLGYEEDELFEKQYLDLIPSEDQKIAQEYFTRISESTKMSDYQEFRVVSSCGDIYWIGQNVTKVDQKGGSFSYSVVARDITQKKETEMALAKAQQALEKSEIKYRSVIENMELGLMEVDTSGTILRAYDRFNEMLGYEEGELEGQNAIEAILVKEYEHLLNREDSKRLEGESGVYEVKLRKKGGEEIWVIISGAPFYNEKGQVAGSIGVHYDITERKELEKQLELAKVKAVKAQQAEKAFLANMSHEIRTPLNAIIGMSHLLIDTDLNQEQSEYLNSLLASASILKSLISDVLDISKIDSGSLDVVQKPVSLKKLGDQLVSTFKVTSLENSVKFIFKCDKDIRSNVFVDPQLLNQILINLLSNAQKFTEQGEIVLCIEKKESNETHIGIKFSVTDTGIGIPPNEVDIIFEEFKQANSDIRMKYGGTGLGLSISNQLVNLLGGVLKVDSKVGGGSTFYFDLDLKKTDKVVKNNESLKSSGIIENRQGRILVVEDNDMNLKYITSLLSKWSIEFDYCRNGQEACEKSEEEQYSLIFMDLQMPVMDGFEATQHIRSMETTNKNVPIVALTASTFLSKKRMALKAGMTDFLSKPFTPDQLSDLIDQYLLRGDHEKLHERESVIKIEEGLDSMYLSQAYGSDVDYALEMFETFVEVLNEELILIKEVIEENDNEALARKIHKIKPIFTMVGLGLITDDLSKAESQIKNAKFGNTQDWFENFKETINSKMPLIYRQIKNLKEWQKN